MIDYTVLSQALSFYSIHGFRQIEIPWITDSDSLRATLPPNMERDPIMWVPNMGGGLVGSAEQGFVQIRNNIPRSLLMAVSPCFRRGDDRSPLHQQTFMKLELHDNRDDRDLLGMVGTALRFYQLHVPDARVIETPEGFDIVDLHGIELGSYGERTHNGYSWVYGTGVALPRLSAVIA